MPKRTYSPKQKKRAKKHGFRKRMKQANHIVKNRRDKGRSKLAHSSKR